MTLAQQWKQEGKKEGNQEGKAGLVSRLLLLKFKDEAEDWKKRLNQLSSDELDRIGDRIITADTLPEVFQGLVA